jgi:antibiotic biosynthesis monooxygenase (ABM) superfamily enzyme
MKEPDQTQVSNHDQVAELFHVSLKTSALSDFLETGKTVDKAFRHLPGYAGMEILILGEDRVTVILRWNSFNSISKYLPRILHAPEVLSWMGNTLSATHQPVILKKMTPQVNTNSRSLFPGGDK